MWTLADHKHYFPSVYLELESVEGIFDNNTTITDFTDFAVFGNVKHLERTFYNASKLTSIMLPSSIEQIDRQAFGECKNLTSIYISCDSVPVLAENAFEDLPDDFKIFVPKGMCKRYREKWTQ